MPFTHEESSHIVILRELLVWIKCIKRSFVLVKQINASHFHSSYLMFGNTTVWHLTCNSIVFIIQPFIYHLSCDSIPERILNCISYLKLEQHARYVICISFYFKTYICSSVKYNITHMFSTTAKKTRTSCRKLYLYSCNKYTST